MNDSVVNPPVCGEPYLVSENQILENLRFWGPGISVSIIGACGLAGNLLSIVAIATFPKSKLTLFYKLLLTLAVFDLLFITNGGLFMTHQAFAFNVSWYNFLFPKCIYPMTGFAMTGSTYACVCIAVERYLGICHSNLSSKYRKLRVYLIGLTLLCLAIDSPRFFEIESVFDEEGNYVRFQYTQLRRSRTYILAYFMWYRLITTVALPFVVMLYCNIRVFLYYKHNNLQTQVKQERTLLIIFTCISATFLICHLPRMILNIYEFKMDQDKEQCLLEGGQKYHRPKWTFILQCVEKILLILNASANFIYYCFAGREFRRQFCKTLLCCKFFSKAGAGENSPKKPTIIRRTTRRKTESPQQETDDNNLMMVKIEQEEPNSSCASAAALEEIEKWRNFVANRAQGHSNSSGGGAEIICAENEKMGTNV